MEHIKVLYVKTDNGSLFSCARRWGLTNAPRQRRAGAGRFYITHHVFIHILLKLPVSMWKYPSWNDTPSCFHNDARLSNTFHLNLSRFTPLYSIQINNTIPIRQIFAGKTFPLPLYLLVLRVKFSFWVWCLCTFAHEWWWEIQFLIFR